ncbi:UPF0764 protein C16orf89-like isoform X2 [Symphalangus syndactylus]|uniref:UPF0764 protein C16orf89-like isoform X2 n=1 Tax=Symphalangus syndactylus TaxID=9590 RepID=UPI0024425723|nr:UPF0764 protein C16orf89-like [Symphalangus syndactylus]
MTVEESSASPQSLNHLRKWGNRIPEMGSRTVAQAEVQWHDHNSLHPRTPGFKQSSCFNLLNRMSYEAKDRKKSTLLNSHFRGDSQGIRNKEELSRDGATTNNDGKEGPHRE